jgi:6-phosphogluconolactonase
MLATAQRSTLLLPILFGAYILSACSSGGGSLSLTSPTYKVGGSVNGLAGSGLTFFRNGSSIRRGANGIYPDLGLGALSAGQAYDVTVIVQPTSPSQTCTVLNGRGTIGSANVTNVQVTCTTSPSRFVYVASSGTNNLSTYTIDATTGELTAVASLSISAGPPHFLAVNPQSRFLYMTNGGSNNVSVYAIDASSGGLTAVNGSPFAAGNNPSSVSIHPSGTLVYVTNQSDGTISAYSQSPASGALIAVAGSPFTTGGNPISLIVPDLTNPLLDLYVYACGGSNNIWAFTINETGTTLTGALTAMSGSPFPAGSSPLSMVADPAANFIYVANQGDGTVSAYSADPASGSLTSIAGSPFAAGGGPSAVADTFGRFVYVANKTDGTISAYQINAGGLQAVTGSPFVAGTGPSSLMVDNLGKFLYAVNTGSNSIAAYAIDPATGALTPLSGSPFSTASGPTSIAVSN